MSTDAQMGLILNIVVGIVGGLIGGFLLRGFGVNVSGGGLVLSFLTCLLRGGDPAGDRQIDRSRTSVPPGVVIPASAPRKWLLDRVSPGHGGGCGMRYR